MPAAPRLLVCDDAPGFRLLMHTVFEDGGFAVAGHAETWAQAEALARQLEPEAVLLDLWLPTFDPAGVVRVRAAAPRSILAVVSSLSTDEVAELVGGIEGVDLVLSKREPPTRMVEAMRGCLA